MDEQIVEHSPERAKILENRLFEQLRKSVAEETTAFTFACGGTIPIAPSTGEATPVAEDLEGLRSISGLPVDLRWDPKDPAVQSCQSKITFPLEPATEGNLEQLIHDMSPATFGRGGEDVLDESYRKATKMDPSQFSATFNPYELGIVDAVAQALLPSLRHSKQPRAVKAELYKLNVYSGPSGKFKSHVDTPRSPSQFGSLVVCLPLEFEGGVLEVRHKGQAVTFDWSDANSGSKSSSPSICWAAFYSDCEHEIFEVTKGHRFTLTYNLYSVRGNGQLGGNYPWLDPTQLPLYQTIRDLVQDKEVWGKGGFIGYNCSHVYPHSNKSKLNFLVPDNLKGADMLMYEIFSSLGLKVSFRPVVKDPGFEADDDHPLPLVGSDLPWQVWEGMIDDDPYREFEDWTGFRKLYRRSPVEDELRYVDFRAVHWLNDRGHDEPQVTWIAYGNQAWNVVVYSCLAMIVEIPPSGGVAAVEDDEE